MKYCEILKFKMFTSSHCKLILLTALLSLIQGCATNQPKKVADVQVKTPTAKIVVVTPEAREDFDTAMRFIKENDYEKAVVPLKKVTAAFPDNAIAHINLALVYKKLNKLKLAEESLKLAMAADPENPVANNEYALLYRKTGRFNEARKQYEKILETYPNFNMAHKNLGILCDLYLKDYQCALNHYVIYSSVVQDDKTVKIWIADMQKRLGK